jgi:signal transduction histidine kinase
MEAFNARPVYTHEGTYRRTLSTGHIVEVADTSTDPDFLGDVGSRARSVTNIPLIAERRAIGLIAIDGLPKEDTTRRLLVALADIAAVAIDKERLHQETADRLAEVSTLYTLSTQITGSLSLSRVLESIVTILKVTIDCRACSIFLIDPDADTLRLEASSGLPNERRALAQLRTDQGIGSRVFAERRSVYISDLRSAPDLGYSDPEVGSLLVVPLIVRNQVVGLLCLDDTRANAFTEEVRLLTIVAAQAAVAIENAQLYETLQVSYHDLAGAYDALRELDRMKSELVQNISHELRTPLTFIKGYLELLQDGDMGELTDEQTAALDIVATKASLLSRLVDDIITLQYSREQVQFRPLSLADVGLNALRTAQVSAAQAQIALRDEIPADLPPVLGDEQRLGQVFDNLLSNALKFSDPGGMVTVRMVEESGSIRTEIEDQGIGIPADKLERIFDRFYQVDGSTTRRFGGTGLGLAIVKQIIESHGGQIGVRSKQGEGSCFHFTIPKAPPQGAQS